MELYAVAKKVFVITFLISSVCALEIELYSEKDRRGQSIKIEVSDNDCSELPPAWHSGVASVDTLGNCVQFYDEPNCKGSLTVIQPFHIIHQMDLSLINYAFRLRTASPCGPKLGNGKYVIQNAADASVMAALNKHGNFAKAFTVNTTMSAAVPKTQQWEVVEKGNNEYVLKPRENSDNYPVSFDEESLKKGVIKRKAWKVMSVGRGRYIIKDPATQRCLYKTDDYKVEEHSCRIWSTNQEWVFRSILGDAPNDKPKAQVGNGINFNILSKVGTSRPPTKPPPQYYPIYFNATKLAQIKKFSTAAPYQIKKKIKRGPRPKTKYVEEPSLDLKPPGLRPALPKNVANNNNYLLFKPPHGAAKDSYLPDEFIPTDDVDLLPTKEMIKNSKQYQQYMDIVKQYLADRYAQALQQQHGNRPPLPPTPNKKKKTKDTEEEEGQEGEEEDEETKEKNNTDEELDDDVNEDEESVSEGTGESRVTERPKKKKNKYNNAGPPPPGNDENVHPPVYEDSPGFMSQVFNKFKSNFAAIVPTVKVPSIPSLPLPSFVMPSLPSLPSVPVPKISVTFSKPGSSSSSDTKEKKKTPQSGTSSSGFTFSYSSSGNKNTFNPSDNSKNTYSYRPGRLFMKASSTSTKRPLTVGSWGIFG